jgi:hypothetical protein
MGGQLGPQPQEEFSHIPASARGPWFQFRNLNWGPGMNAALTGHIVSFKQNL